MQRRAAAIYFAIFVLLGAGAFAFIQVGMSQPHVELDGPTYGENDTLDVGDRTYRVSTLEASGGGGGGGHGGGGGGISHEGELLWFNESARESETLGANDTVEYDPGSYQVRIDNGSGGSSVSLVEQFNVSRLLANDPEVDNETATQGDQEYVFYGNGTRTPLDSYLPEPEVIGPYSEGDTIPYPNETVTSRVGSIMAESVTITWSAPGNETVSFDGGENVTLAGQEYFAHFESNDSVQILPTDQYYGVYQAQLTEIDDWGDRRMGLWATVFLSFIGGMMLFMSALMPVKG